MRNVFHWGASVGDIVLSFQPLAIKFIIFTARFAQDAKIAKVYFLSNRNGRFDKSVSPSGGFSILRPLSLQALQNISTKRTGKG